MDDLELSAELNDSESAALFKQMLPLTFSMNRWGEEYYGGCGIQAEESSDAKEVMEVGELAIWPPGHAFCIFFGPTPASDDEKPRAASPVNPIGKIIDDPFPMKKLGQTIKVHVDIKEDGP
jgi:hypothetical protein